jgi:hypothetical protein
MPRAPIGTIHGKATAETGHEETFLSEIFADPKKIRLDDIWSDRE